MEQILIALLVAGCIGIVLSMAIFFLASRRKARAVSNGRAKPVQAERVNDGGSGGKRGRGGKDKITGASSLDPIVSDRPQKKIAVKIKNHTDKKGGHPHIILGDVDENHVSVGLTTKPKKGKTLPIIKWKSVRWATEGNHICVGKGLLPQKENTNNRVADLLLKKILQKPRNMAKKQSKSI